jgi:hypothetical protein
MVAEPLKPEIASFQHELPADAVFNQNVVMAGERVILSRGPSACRSSRARRVGACVGAEPALRPGSTRPLRPHLPHATARSGGLDSPGASRRVSPPPLYSRYRCCWGRVKLRRAGGEGKAEGRCYISQVTERCDPKC